MTATLDRPLDRTLDRTLYRRHDPLPELLDGAIVDELPRRRTAERTAVFVLTLGFVFQPMLHPTGPGNSSPVDIFLVASIVAAAIWARSSHRRLRAPYFIPVALMMVGGAASGLVGSVPTTSLMALVVDLLLLAWCTTIVNVLSKPRALRYAMVAWSWSGIFWAAVVVVAWLGHITKLEGLQAAEGNRVLFTFGDPNYASTYWDATIFIVYAMKTPTTRWIRVVGYALLVCALALTESNGGALALGVGVVFLLLVRSYRARGWAGAAAVTIVGGLAVGAFLTAFPLNTLRQAALTSNQPLLVNSIGRSAQSSQERSQLISEMRLLYLRSDGVLGLGPGSTKPLLTTGFYPYPNEAHDDYLAALVERGPLGLIGLLLLVGSAVLWSAPVVRKRQSPGFAAAVPAPVGMVAGLLALSVNSFYEEILHFRFLWALLGVVAILGWDARRAEVERKRAALRGTPP